MTVWDGGASGGKTISNFVKDYATSLPPLHDLLKMAGVVAPGFMGVSELENQANDNSAGDVPTTTIGSDDVVKI